MTGSIQHKGQKKMGKKYIVIAAIIVPFLIAAIVNMADSRKQRATERHDKYEKRKLERAERFTQGPFVASEKEIAPGERIRVVVIPSKDGHFFDTNCVLYTNPAAGTSSITCPESLNSNE
jgi:hypothetical protein